MDRTLIVARMEPESAEAVAEIFAESDNGELPHLLGVTRRTLFRYHELYLHLVETDRALAEPLDRMRSHPLFKEISARLEPHIKPYSPDWSGPRDAIAASFYQWQPGSQVRSDRD